MSSSVYHLSFSKENKYNGFNACIIFSPDLENRIKQEWGVLFEVEWLAGERVTNDQGQIEIRFNCPKEKEMQVQRIMHFRQFFGGHGPSVN